MSNEIDVSLDGVDRDCPENPRQHRKLRREMRALVDDLTELAQMSESDLRRYCGHC